MEKKVLKNILPQLSGILHFMFNRTTDLVVLLNNKYELLWMNESNYRRALGYSKDDVIGKNVISLIHPDDRKYTPKQIERILRKGGKIVGRLKKKSGDYRWYEIWGYYFEDSKNKQKILVVLRDITERKITEVKLIQSEIKYRQLFDSNPSIILIMDLSGIIVDYNVILEKIGFEENELLGKNFRQLTDIIPEGKLSLFNKIFDRIITKGTIRKNSVKLHSKDGFIIIVSVKGDLIEIERNKFVQIILTPISILKREK